VRCYNEQSKRRARTDNAGQGNAAATVTTESKVFTQNLRAHVKSENFHFLKN
jgi:hypothetical protein